MGRPAETDYTDIVTDIQRAMDLSNGFTAWEIDFIESLDGKTEFSPKQQKCLDDLWEKATSLELASRD